MEGARRINRSLQVVVRCAMGALMRQSDRHLVARKKAQSSLGNQEARLNDAREGKPRALLHDP